MNRRGYFLMGLGALLIVFAMGLLVYNAWDENRGNAEVDVVMPRLLKQIESDGGNFPVIKESDQAAADPDSATSGAANASETAEDSSLPKENLLASDELDSIEVDGISYIGYLTITGLELELPVISEWSYPALKISPARYEESSQKHGLIIAGHNYSRHFGKLNTLSVGDPILFTDIHGTTYHFKVSEIQELSPDDIAGMVSGNWDLTLFTCTYGGANRVTIRCVYNEPM